MFFFYSLVLLWRRRKWVWRLYIWSWNFLLSVKVSSSGGRTFADSLHFYSRSRVTGAWPWPPSSAGSSSWRTRIRLSAQTSPNLGDLRRWTWKRTCRSASRSPGSTSCWSRRWRWVTDGTTWLTPVLPGSLNLYGETGPDREAGVGISFKSLELSESGESFQVSKRRLWCLLQKQTPDFKIIQPGVCEPKHESFNRTAAVIPFTHLTLKSMQV